MQKKTLLISLFFITIISYSQDKKISVELNYPLTIIDDYSKNYKGIIDVGAKYRLFSLDNFNFGLSLNYTMTKWKESFNSGFLVNGEPAAENIELEVTDNIFQPKVFVEIKINSIKKIIPFVEIGYSFSSMKATNVTISPDKLDGFNFNVGISYNITNNLFTQIKYNYIIYGKEELPFFNQTQTFKLKNNFLMLGLGYKL